MEKTMVSFNIPNLVTINLMAWAGFLIIALISQFLAKRRGGSAATNGGAPIEVATEGY